MLWPHRGKHANGDEAAKQVWASRCDRTASLDAACPPAPWATMPPKKTGAALTLGLRSWVNRSTGAIDMVVPDKVSVAAFRGERLQVIQWLNGGHVDALAANGDGLLHAAAAGGRLLVAKELLKRGATVDLRGSSNTTPLMFAAACEQHAIVSLLLEHGAEVDLQNDTKDSALVAAAGAGGQECVQELLSAGARVDLPNGVEARLVVPCAYCVLTFYSRSTHCVQTTG